MFGLSLSPNVIFTSSTVTDVLQTVYNKNYFLYFAEIEHVHSKWHSCRGKMRAFMSNNLPSDKKEELKYNIEISSYNKVTCTRSTCFVCQTLPVMIMLIYKVLKSSKGHFVYSRGSFQNMLWVFVIRIEMLQIAVAVQGLAFGISTSSN